MDYQLLKKDSAPWSYIVPEMYNLNHIIILVL
jgi:hypothetical protein